MSKSGAIYEVSDALVAEAMQAVGGALHGAPDAVIVAGLKRIDALPANAQCAVAVGAGTDGPCLLIKALSDELPLVGEGQVYPRRAARAGNTSGQKLNPK